MALNHHYRVYLFYDRPNALEAFRQGFGFLFFSDDGLWLCGPC